MRIADFDWNEAYLCRDHLPHLRQKDAIYFVTFRLGDSLPAGRVDQLRRARDNWLLDHPRPHTEMQDAEYRAAGRGRSSGCWMQGHGECVLRDSNCQIRFLRMRCGMRTGEGIRWGSL